MSTTTAKTIDAYNQIQSGDERQICVLLKETIDHTLPNAESKIWHGSPVWFLDGNPIVGYSKLKAGIKLMFWSGADFEEPALTSTTGKFKDASIIYTQPDQIDVRDLMRWIKKSIRIQWDYKNIVKRRGKLVRISN